MIQADADYLGLRDDLAAAGIALKEKKVKRRFAERISFMRRVRNLLEKDGISTEEVSSLFVNTPAGNIREKIIYMLEDHMFKEPDEYCLLADEHRAPLARLAKIIGGLGSKPNQFWCGSG